MSYATLMVHLDLFRSNTGLLKVTAELAERFGAGVIGIAAGQQPPMIYKNGYVPVDLVQQGSNEVVARLAETKAEFDSALAGHRKFVEWRETRHFVDLVHWVATESRAADLVLTSVGAMASIGAPRSIEIGRLVLEAGRPVLIVPASTGTLTLQHALIGWKDTPEARRAVKNALPLLKKASRVSIVEMASEDDLPSASTHVRDVVSWLRRQGIEACGKARSSTGNDATALREIARDEAADILVAGAYGHGRLSEWVLGGVTRDLILSNDQCSLVSH